MPRSSGIAFVTLAQRLVGAAGPLRLAAMLPRVNWPLAATLAALVLVSAILPVGFTLAAGSLLGAVPAAARDGLGSPAGTAALQALAVAGALFAAQLVVAPIRSIVATILGHELDLHLEERVMWAVTAPSGIGHLEDPATLDRISAAQEVGMAGHRAGDAVTALANIAPRWLEGAGYALALSGCGVFRRLAARTRQQVTDVGGRIEAGWPRRGAPTPYTDRRPTEAHFAEGGPVCRAPATPWRHH